MDREDDETLPPDPVEDAFALYLQQHDAGAAPDFDAFCAERPTMAEELRRMHAVWRQHLRVFESLAGEAPLSRRVEERFGAGVDPRVTLDTPPDPRGERAAEPPPLALSSPGARYRVVDRIGQGGMGVVDRVWDQDLRRSLAMKRIRTDDDPASESAGGTSPERVGRFLEEAQITGQLDHPGIVPVHELALDREGRAFFTMKLVRGRHLGEIITRVHSSDPEWTLTRTLNVLLRVCEALAFAHSKGVIHRDLKPDNVMVGAFGETYVMDWGLARVIHRDGAEDESASGAIQSVRRDLSSMIPGSPFVTREGHVVGTPAYMSPEQAAGRIDELGPATDIFALGAILYHLLAGRPPFHLSGAPAAGGDLVSARESAPPIGDLDLAVPPELISICDRAMRHAPESRYASAAALADDLRAYLENRVVKAHATGAVVELRKWIARNRGTAATAAALLLVLVTAGFLVGWQERRAATAIRKERDRVAISEAETRAERDQVLRLADARRLDELIGGAEKLWPAHPDRIVDMEAWLRRADDLVRGFDTHRETLDRIRREAPRVDDPAQERVDSRLDDLVARRDAAAEERRVWQWVLESKEASPSEGGPDPDALREAIARYDRQVAAAEADIARRRRWTFVDTETQWQHDQLEELVERLEEFQSDDPAIGAVANVRDRLTFATDVTSRSIDDRREAWNEAIDAAARIPAYGGLTLTPQVGLIPIGRDRDSGLLEFWHLQSGERPARADDGRLKITDDSGIVLVLIPGGTFSMGARPDSELDPDPQANSDEQPVVDVTLSPFFLSKYEMTQGQWYRASYRFPSNYGPGGGPADRRTRHNPVEQVDFYQSRDVLRRLDLNLPTEAQWEYACRAGTSTPWSTGADATSLQDHANIADEGARSRLPAELPAEPGVDDGFAAHAPVGSFLPNPFGLHDVHGNVYEWCSHGWNDYRDPRRAGDGKPEYPSPRNRISRGGSFLTRAVVARSAARNVVSPGHRFSDQGVRPARALRSE